jgi:hypothetical protein
MMDYLQIDKPSSGFGATAMRSNAFLFSRKGIAVIGPSGCEVDLAPHRGWAPSPTSGTVQLKARQ